MLLKNMQPLNDMEIATSTTASANRANMVLTGELKRRAAPESTI